MNTLKIEIDKSVVKNCVLDDTVRLITDEIDARLCSFIMGGGVTPDLIVLEDWVFSICKTFDVFSFELIKWTYRGIECNKQK